MDNRLSEKLFQLLENEGQITNELLYSVVQESRELRDRLINVYFNALAAEQALNKMYKEMEKDK